MANNNQTGLPWHIVEAQINKEIEWLKANIPTRGKMIADDIYNKHGLKCEHCDYYYRKIALLIIQDKIKAREIKAKGIKDLWDGLTIQSNTLKKEKHGGEWHRTMMGILEKYFTEQGYEVMLEPHLNHGRADLGIFKNNEKTLYVEIDTVSIHKLWVNLQTMKDCKFLIVPSVDKVIEFEI